MFCTFTIQWLLVTKCSDRTKPFNNKVVWLVRALHILGFPFRIQHILLSLGLRGSSDSHYKNLLLVKQWGLAPRFRALSFEKVNKKHLTSVLPIYRSCQTPKVINPSMISKAVVLCNSINIPLSDGPILSIMVHKQLVRICLGVNLFCTGTGWTLYKVYGGFRFLYGTG